MKQLKQLIIGSTLIPLIWSMSFAARAMGDAPDGSGPVSNAASAEPESQSTQLQEVLVTAQKVTENIMTVPVAVTVVSAQTLLSNNLTGIRDFYSQVPGLAITALTSSQANLSIDGIATSPTGNPTVGVTIDDVPIGASTNNGGGIFLPDFDPSDLAGIEVLHGPQGTLYGASSMGGIVKYETVDPSTARLSGRVEAGADTVHNSAGMGYFFRGAVNVPISSTLAVRVSGFDREDPGYIDNPILHNTDVNVGHAFGAYVSALWQPSDALSLKLGYFRQETKANSSSSVNFALQPVFAGHAPLGDLQQDYVAGVGPYDDKIELYSAVLKASLGGVQLTSITGYNVNSSTESLDTTQLVGGLAQLLFQVGGSPEYAAIHNSNVSQELRLAGSIGQRIDWLVGGFYTHQYTTFNTQVWAIDPLSGAVASKEFYNNYFPTAYNEYAGFANLTYHVNTRFSVQFGARESHYSEIYQLTPSGIVCPVLYAHTSPCPNAKEYSSSTPFTYLVTPKFNITPDLMVYARFSSGYRAGGGNPTIPGVSKQYDPDKTYDYEVGLKGMFFEHTLSVSASSYYIDWKNIQVSLVDPQAIFYFGNVSSAKSEGLNLAVRSQPIGGLVIGGWVNYNEAKLTASFPPAAVAAGTYGVEGDRLPWSPKFSGNLSVDDEFPLADRITGFAGMTLSYTGSRLDQFTSSAVRQYLPAYARAGARAGIDFDSWKVTAYVNNLTDRRGLISGGLGNPVPTAFFIIEPRQIGLSVAKTF